ncbi:translocation/assembly module TamB domain-containing protein [Sphingomonas donggukensis]|uniref:Translocation/assembly module TamB domain-containing protein n=1 Tax=Sphingomonas donggukensis TaxID=2949093 RepID=A0ABY4TSY7_9SPHN|nr:translocation/assembly module TamB domain-containing protein [Sphingomonas donggukensis]URW75515.1 translocation/assembly module TamB domain-containing protein [Sphingomonas donggukensis]
MTDAATEIEGPPPRVHRLWIGRFLLLALLLAGVLVAAAALLDTQLGHRFVADRIAAQRPSNGLRYSVGRIEGSLYGKATLVDVRIRDADGLVFRAPRAQLDWRPFAWVANRLTIRSLVIPAATLEKLPRILKSGRKTPILPGFDISIGELRIDRLMIAPAVTGIARSGSLNARAEIHEGRALVNLDAVVQGSDRLRLRLDAEPDRDRFDADVSARGTASGVLAKLTGIARPLALELHGDGRWSAWRGTTRADVGDARLADLTLTNAAGRYGLSGSVAPSLIAGGKVQRLTAPRVAVNGAATLADRRLDGTLSLRSPALAVDTVGAIDLAAATYRNVRIAARLLRPPALFPNMTGRGVALRAILDGPFATAAFDYRLTAERVAFDDTGFEGVRAAGRGRLSPMPVILPVALTAQRVTGVGDVAGGILRNLSVTGPLRITSREITGDALVLRSDKLNGRITLFLDLRTGRYEVGLTGGLRRYLIPGIGLVDVQSQLKVVPGPNGKGTRVVGRGSANVVRLDNAFFASLTNGLPRITTGLERGNDGILYLRGLQFTSPGLKLSGNGFRRRDGTFHFEGSGSQVRYGPLTLRLDGRIERPTLDLTFARPADALGLRDVRAHLDPTAEGFAFIAAGGSRLGAFTGNGAILLPKGGAARIQVARLDVAGTRASGALDIVDGGFAGQLDVSGGGLSGNLAFRPQGGIQRIDISLDARAARLADALTIRRGHVEAAVLLDPAGTSIDATVTAQGLRRGALSLGRLAANVKLVGGVGEVRASFAGNRGRAFAIQSVIGVTPDRYTVQAQGTVDRRPIALTQPAIFTRDGDGWRLQGARLSFAGGEAQVAGRFSGTESAVEASLARMPLSVLDIGYPGLGLGGSATGTLRYVATAGGAPTGRIDMTVRGLTRSGLILSSRPIDVGIAGVLDASKAGVRAVMASGGQTIGRAQALLTPLAGGDLATRLANAPLVGQIRYQGPADTLWRLTGVELFDLSGPVAIGADVSGRLASPRIIGSVRTENARIESATTGTVLRGVAASGRFGGSRLVIDRFTAQDAGQGRVSGSGAFDFAAANGIGIDLSVQAQDAQLIGRDDIAATVTGPLRFRSDGSGGVISGQVVVGKGRYRLGRAAQAVAVPRLNIREVNVPGGDEDDGPVRAPWRLDLDARIADGFVVQGLGLDSIWSGALKIGGEPTNPRITGRLDLVRGDYEFAGREFEIDRGIIRFDGSVPANPALDIAANADTQGLNATIRVTGTAEKPEIGFTSVPALPEDELLSRLLFGTSITSLSAPEALQLAAAVSALQNGGNGLNPINAVRRAAGLDRLRILPADPQTGAGTAIAAGKYLTRRVYAEIISDGQGYSATRVEFQVTRWLSLLSSISTIGRQSANVRVSKDY